MAPPRAARMTDPPVTKKTHNVHKNVEKEPCENSQTGSNAVHEQSENDESKLSQGTAVQKMIIGNLNDRKMHLAINKKKVKEGYEIAKVDLQDRITAIFDAHEEQSDAAHSAQMQRLADLLAAKAAIESQMDAKLAHLRTLYDAHSRELTSVVSARIKELK